MKWEEYFDKTTLYRGFEYFNIGYIESIIKTNNIIDARVSGSEGYHVHIDLEHLEDMTCTCPFFKNGNRCKHLAAVLYAVDNHKYEEVIKKETKKEEYDIDKMVDECDEYFLRNFIKYELKKDKNLQKEFIDNIPSLFIYKK